MTEVTPRSPATVTVPLGHVLSVTAPEGRGMVWRMPGDPADKPQIEFWIGPKNEFRSTPSNTTVVFKIEATLGAVNYEITEPAQPPVVEVLAATLPRATEIVTSHRIITHAIHEGRKAMSLQEKMKRLADRASAVPKALEAKADALLPRLDALEQGGEAAFGKLHTVVADAEAGVAAAESALAQLTNGGPPLP